MEHPFFAFLFRMKYINRWGLMKNTVSENIEEHSLEVAVLAHALALIGREIYSRDIDAERVACLALYHDAPEIITGDLPTPVKYYSEKMRDVYREVEQDSVEKLLRMLPEELAPAYRACLTGEENEAELYRYVKAADKLAAYIKCLEELKAGNREFHRAALSNREALERLELPELAYFCKHFLGSFELTLDEMDLK